MVAREEEGEELVGPGRRGEREIYGKRKLEREELRGVGGRGTGVGVGEWDLAFGDGTWFAEAWLGSGTVTPGFVHTTHE